MLSRFSHVRLCMTPSTATHQAPPSTGFSRQEYWSGLPFLWVVSKACLSNQYLDKDRRLHGVRPGDEHQAGERNGCNLYLQHQRAQFKTEERPLPLNLPYCPHTGWVPNPVANHLMQKQGTILLSIFSGHKKRHKPKIKDLLFLNITLKRSWNSH